MLVDLVQVTTRDGFRLDGAYLAPSGPKSLPLDALCFVHGTGGNFYSSTLFDALTDRLRALGCGVLRINTRGHDGISTASTDRGGRRQGAAYEIADECRHDLRAWLDWLRQHSGPRVGLLGHSFGAVKCLYALAHEPDPACVCVVALSPPRLAYATFCESVHAPNFLETYQRAEELVRQGQPTTLIEATQPLPYAISAAGYVEKYGPDERYNFLRFIGQVGCPVLVTFGGQEVETNMAFQGVPEALQPLAAKHGRLAVGTVPGGDHFYSSVRGALVAHVESWLRQLA